MKTNASTLRIVRFQFQDALSSRWLLVHTLIYLLIAEGLLMSTGFTDKALVSLVNVVLLLVPLVALLFGVIHHYNNRDYTTWMLTQPLERRGLFTGLYLGLTVPMVLSFCIGITLPFLWHGGLAAGQIVRLLTLLGLGTALTFSGVGVAASLAIRFTDRIRGIGLALVIWLIYALLFDGLILMGISVFGDWPIEKALIGAMLLNPIDLSRLILLQTFDAAAMLGYTGAVFSRFFGSQLGVLIASSAILFWVASPIWLAGRLFRKQDF